ncbi:MAG: peptidyl-prolyl cis-trans isomerase [Candidatus Omnitrophota bacterium]
MTRTPKEITKIFLCLTVFLFMASPSVFSLEDTIIAVVNGDVITLHDFRDYLSSLFIRLRAQGLSQAEIEERIVTYQNDGLNKLIEEKLLIDAANAKGMEIRDKAIEDKINEVKSQYPSEKVFLDALTSEGLTLGDVKEKIANDLKIKFIIEREVKSKIFVNPQDVTDHYEKNISLFQKPERIELDSIGIKLDIDNKGAAQKKAEEAHARLLAGEDFAQVAKEFSEIPNIGVVARGQMLQNIEDIIYKLKPGDISPVIQTDSALLIVKVVRKFPQEVAPLEDVREKIYQAIFQDKYHQRLMAWLQELKQSAYIDIKQQQL